MQKSPIPCTVGIAPRGKSWVDGRLVDGEHGSVCRPVSGPPVDVNVGVARVTTPAPAGPLVAPPQCSLMKLGSSGVPARRFARRISSTSPDSFIPSRIAALVTQYITHMTTANASASTMKPASAIFPSCNSMCDSFSASVSKVFARA